MACACKMGSLLVRMRCLTRWLAAVAFIGIESDCWRAVVKFLRYLPLTTSLAGSDANASCVVKSLAVTWHCQRPSSNSRAADLTQREQSPMSGRPTHSYFFKCMPIGWNNLDSIFRSFKSLLLLSIQSSFEAEEGRLQIREWQSAGMESSRVWCLSTWRKYSFHVTIRTLERVPTSTVTSTGWENFPFEMENKK